MYVILLLLLLLLLSFQFTVIKALTVCCCLFTFVELWMHVCVAFFSRFSFSLVLFLVLFSFCFEPNKTNSLLIFAIFASSIPYTVLLLFNVLNGISTIFHILWLKFYTLYVWLPHFNHIIFGCVLFRVLNGWLNSVCMTQMVY